MSKNDDLFQTSGAVMHAWPSLMTAFKGKGNVVPVYALKAYMGSRFIAPFVLNPLNTELNSICHLLALLGAHHILHVGRIRVNIVTRRM